MWKESKLEGYRINKTGKLHLLDEHGNVFCGEEITQDPVLLIAPLSKICMICLMPFVSIKEED